MASLHDKSKIMTRYSRNLYCNHHKILSAWRKQVAEGLEQRVGQCVSKCRLNTVKMLISSQPLLGEREGK